MRISHLAIVMPAYNEAEGIPGFLDEIATSAAQVCNRLSMVVVDDRSTDDTPAVLDRLAADRDDLTVIHAENNRGHGPSALAAYRAGIALEPQVIVHVDGDGQFLGDDIARVALAVLQEDADVVHGVRRSRTDPWFRQALTWMVGIVVGLAAGRRVPDVNTPLRAYRPVVVEYLANKVPDDALVPHVHFSLTEARQGFIVRYLAVRSIPRRGSEQTGTMWGAVKAPKLPPARLRAFVRGAAVELWKVSLRPGAPGRKL